MQFGGLFYAIMTLFKHIKLLLDAFISSNTFLCTWTIKIINYSVIKCQKNGAKMNKIVQKWQFQKTFYTTMETVLGFSPNRLAELFQNYVFSTNQYLYFDLYVAECQIQKIWPMSQLGVYVYSQSLIIRIMVSKNVKKLWCIVNFRFTIISGFSRITVMII